MCFGELNVFPKSMAATILRRAAAALTPAGKLVIEVHRRASIQQMSERPPKWSTHHAGLFSASPHLLLEESFWDDSSQAATKRYHVVDAATGDTTHYAASYQAHSDDDYEALLRGAGLTTIRRYASMTGEPAPNHGPCADLMVFVASRS